MTLNIRLKPDKQHVLLSLLREQIVLDNILLTSDAIGRLISLLSNNRAQLAEPVPHELDPNARVETVVRPSWRLRPPRASGADGRLAPEGAIVEVRHPGLGWLGFHFDADDADKLGRGLLAIAAELRASRKKREVDVRQSKIAKETFFFDIGVAMYITQLCPNIKVNFSNINAAAQAADVDLQRGISAEAYPEAAPKLLGAMAFVAMMNDAGGPFPCDSIIKMLATKNADQTWKEFLLVPDARND